MQTIWAEQALIGADWRKNVLVGIDAGGRIASVAANSAPQGERVGLLLPAPANLHSHAFQRAMAGMTEMRGPDPRDTFWTWRELMFRFLDRLDPDDIQAITALVQMEMLEAGYCAVAEFHYLHHQPGGIPYDDVSETACRIAAAAEETGIGLTLLPVFYEQGGCDGRPLGPGQIRFGNDVDRYIRLHEGGRAALAKLPADASIGVAPHSLRACSQEGLARVVEFGKRGPIHIHVAEQVGEVEEITAAWGARPVEWMVSNHKIDQRWCFIHATQMLETETLALARSGAIAGLCPITESNLGDGIFDGVRYLEAGGRFGIGSDSNIRIALVEELRTFEYSQRLRDRGRAMLAQPEKPTGRILFDGAVAGGAQASGRDSGTIANGKLADLVAIDLDDLVFLGGSGDSLLDRLVFTGDDSTVTDVWAAGRHVVSDGKHHKHDSIVSRYRKTINELLDRL